jgi:hypothetical protein
VRSPCGTGTRPAGADLVRARLNAAEVDAGGRQWSAEFTAPAAYLEENAELAYAGNVFVVQGRTVDTAHLVVSEGMCRDLLYVGMTRSREVNWAHVAADVDPATGPRSSRPGSTSLSTRLGAQDEVEAVAATSKADADDVDLEI